MAGSHWKAAEDPRTGRTYYYHEITRETQWRKPTELASDEERRAMEDKERKQKDFFAAMEANILHSLSQGQVPGTPVPKELERRKSSRKVAERPELVRTISTMDSLVLKDLIQRQPSFRNISRNPSLSANDFRLTRSSHINSADFESFVSIMSDKDHLHPLDESAVSNDDSLPGLFSYLPDDNELDLDDSINSTEDSDGKIDSKKVNESRKSGSGLTWEETQALRKLASITKEMIDVDKEDEDLPVKSNSTAQAPNLINKDTKPIRDLPREIELDDSSADEDESESGFQKPSSAFQKAKDIGGRELDFDESDDDDDVSDSGIAPTPMKPSRSGLDKKEKPAATQNRLDQRPDIKRRNTCGTLYVGTTMSAPDKDANIKVTTMTRVGKVRRLGCSFSLLDLVPCSAFAVS
jgi:hypothetical protein